MPNAIEARGLKKTYPGEIRALDGLSLKVEEGTVFGLVGPNGAGKSTTVKILTTLSRPNEGEALVTGLNVLDHPDEVRSVIGVVAQSSGLDPAATGHENARLQGHVYGHRGRELERRIDELLEQLDLADAGDRMVRTYSGGMQRRLDIALALVHQPRVLFMDEPTTGLDPEVRVRIWVEILRLAREEGLTVLMTTHYMEEADELASRLAIVDRGHVVAEGSPDALKGELRGDAVHVELGDTAVNGRIPEALGRVVEAGRSAAVGPTDWPVVLSRTGLLIAFLLACGVFATRAFRTYQRAL